MARLTRCTKFRSQAKSVLVEAARLPGGDDLALSETRNFLISDNHNQRHMSFPYYSPSGWLFYPALLSPTQSQLSHPTPNLIPQAVQPVPLPLNAPATPTKRKAYHPPSSAKSSYCIWVGNVPADSTVDELFKYFSRQSPHSPRLNLNEYAALPPNCGLLSIHLISKVRRDMSDTATCY